MFGPRGLWEHCDQRNPFIKKDESRVDGTTLDVGLEPVYRPALDISTLSDAVRRIREGVGKWDQETLARETCTGENQDKSVI